MGAFTPVLGSMIASLLGSKKKGVHDFFSDSELARLKQATTEAEMKTSGEIRVCITMDFSPDINSVQMQAVHEFVKYGMEKTEERNGVLILLVWNERQFYIHADEGIYNLLGDDYWDTRARMLASHFKGDNYVNALIGAVTSVGEELSARFPRRSDDRNELSDDVIVEGE